MTESRREPMWRRYLRLVRPDVAADVEDELRFHLEMLMNEYEAQGMAPAEARRRARERFGDGEQVARWLRIHDERRLHAAYRRENMGTLASHIRFAARGLRRQPAFTAAAVLTLALGIGATTAIFGVVNGVLLEPLPFPQPESLVGLWHTSPLLGATLAPVSYGTYDTYRRLNRMFTGIALYDESAVNITSASAQPERVTAVRVTASFFPVLGVTPLLGRSFTTDDDRPGHDGVVMIGEGFWRRQFGGSPTAIGKPLRLDGTVHEIIGVVAERTRFPQGDAQLWLPLAIDPLMPNPASFNYEGVGRLRAGVTPATAAADLQRVLPRIVELHPIAIPGMSMTEFLAKLSPRAVVHPLRDDVVGDIGRVLWVIFGTIGFVLLAACANIANLCLVRAEGRRGELAVRAALGAGRGDVVARFLVEGLLLAGAGAVVGVALAGYGLGALRRTSTLPIPRLAEVGLDGRVLGVATLVTLAVALVTSALPMLRLGMRDLAPLLRAGGRGATGGRDRRRLQHGLVVAQVALAFVLLASCTLMARTFVELRRVRLGFDAERALTFRVALPYAGYDESAVARFHADLADRLARLPGVQAIGATSRMPLEEEGHSSTPVWIEGDRSRQADAPPARSIVIASPGYFRSLGTPFTAGREFLGLRENQGAAEAIVNTAFARQAMADVPEHAVVGRRIRLLPTAPWLTIVGVVGSIRDEAIDREASPTVYLPYRSIGYGDVSSPRTATVVVRTAGDPGTLGGAVRREVGALDASLPVYDMRPLSAVVRASMARTSFTALLLTIAAVVALVLGAIGLYGVVAYTVALRRREIGLRIALGGRPHAVGRLLALQGARLAAVGVGVGFVGAIFVTRVLGALLYGVSATDPLTLGGTAVLLVVVSCAASWVPARRAARVDPAEVLSAD